MPMIEMPIISAGNVGRQLYEHEIRNYRFEGRRVRISTDVSGLLHYGRSLMLLADLCDLNGVDVNDIAAVHRALRDADEFLDGDSLDHGEDQPGHALISIFLPTSEAMRIIRSFSKDAAVATRFTDWLIATVMPEEPARVSLFNGFARTEWLIERNSYLANMPGGNVVSFQKRPR